MYDESEDDRPCDSLDIERRALSVATQLARAALAGDLNQSQLRERMRRVLGQAWPWIGPLIRQIRLDYGDSIGGAQHDELVRSILEFAPLRSAFESAGEVPRIRGWYPFQPPMGEPPARLLAKVNALPRLATPGDLTDWLGLPIRELDWFAASRRSDLTADGPLCHYRYRWLAKRRGGYRLIEIPKPRLRGLQRRVLHRILEQVPAHDAAHGCVSGRSTVSAALPHSGKQVVLQIDLQDFFTGVTAGRVYAMFRTLGYPPAAARTLTGLVTHSTPYSVLRAAPTPELGQHDDIGTRTRRHAMLRIAHLPQGAPSSPALANLCAYRLDLRLSGAAAACGISYTRYVDDLIFSGDDAFARKMERVKSMLYSIIVDEGFEPHYRKTRAQRQATSQRIVGMVVNQKPNVPRREFDTLKAILHNCRRHGPQGENRLCHPRFRQHLLGRIARVAQLSPHRGETLLREFRQIEWPPAEGG